MKIITKLFLIILASVSVVAACMWVKSRSKDLTSISTATKIRNCPLCNNAPYSVYMNDTAWNNHHGVELRQCDSCSFVYSKVFVCDYEGLGGRDPFPTQSNEQLKKQLFEMAQKERLPQFIDEVTEKAALQGGKSLDFGCGIGLSSLCLQKKGFNTYGVESSPVFLQKHKDLKIISTQSLSDFNDEKETFDLVIMKDVLEHVNNPVQMLSELLPFVKPGGYFYIRVPNVYHYPFHWSIDTRSHVNHFTPQHLMDLLEKNKMQKVDFIGVYDISTTVGELYNFVFWRLRNVVPMYHQISLLYQKPV